MKIVIIGGTGLIGQEVIKLACNDIYFTQINALVRNSLSLSHPKINQLIVNFDKLYDYKSAFEGQALICTLGTTKKQSPNKEAYRKIDLTYTLESCKIAIQHGFEQVHLISSIGANEKSSVFYPALKGEIEREVSALCFPSTFIYRPSLLLGKRKKKRGIEVLSEVFLSLINPLLIGAFKKYRGIAAEQIAKKILSEIKNKKAGIHYFESNEI